MAIQSFLLLLHLLLVISGGVAAGRPSSVITSTCSLAARSLRWQTPYGYCVRTLLDNPVTASAADTRGLAIAAANLTAANVTHTELVIGGLIENLRDGLETYKGMSRAVTGGIGDLRTGRLDAAVDKLYYASGLPTRCSLAFMYAEQQSPIDKEIVADSSLATLASSITDLLKSPIKSEITPSHE